MRRGIKQRKKKNIMIKEINFKSFKLIVFLTSILIICCIIYLFIIKNFLIRKAFEKENINIFTSNETFPYSINKIILFSSAHADGTIENHSYSSLNVSQYCDIGIYLNKLTNDDSYISSLFIDNISISSPKLGNPYLYKKKVPDLGKCSFSENILIGDRFDFNVINSSQELSYDNYEIYNNLSTPISLGFYNKNVKAGFLSDNSEILYNGSILKEATIPLSSITCTINFRINIISLSGEHYICNISFDIPFEDEHGSIYNTGHTIKEFNGNETNKFIRIK